MPLVGHVYRVTNALEAFAPVILSDTLPTSGFVPWPGSTVIAHYYWKEPFFDFLPLIPHNTATVAGDGSFSLSDPPPPVVESLFPVWVSLSVTFGVTVYRSTYIPLSKAQDKELDLWLYVDTLPISDGISAGTISQQVAGQGLPDNTIITAGDAYGLNFAGSEGPVYINFNIWIAADTSPNLNDFLDLSISRWDITSSSPWVSADDVLNRIKSGIAGAGSSINKTVLQRMEGILQTQEGLTPLMATNFLGYDVSVTFYDIRIPTSYEWGIGDTSNNTIVLVANPCIGYPRYFWQEPDKLRQPLLHP